MKLNELVNSNEGILRKRKGNFNTIVFYFLVNGISVGAAIVQKIGKTYKGLLNFRIYPDYRGKGYGSRFFKKIMMDKDAPNHITAKPWHKIGEPGLSFNDLIKFYKKFGFTVINRHGVQGAVLRHKSVAKSNET